LILLFLDATWKYAKEMDHANLDLRLYPPICTYLYPPNLQRVQLNERDDLQPILQQKARRFAIRKAPSDDALSTAECLTWVVAQVEDDPTIYEVLMKPLNLMVQKWNNFKQKDVESAAPTDPTERAKCIGLQ